MREQGWVSGDHAREVARRLGVPLHRVEGLLSFYPHFRRTPPPRLEVAVCRDMSCWLRGAEALGRRAAGLAGDGVEVREVSCLGACEEAPVCAVNGHPFPGARLDEAVAGAPPP